MPIETQISTIRHAHTQYNTEKRYAGTIDVPLNKRGLSEARKAASAIEEMHFDVVVTSTMQRSIQTAQILVGDSVRLVKSKLCNERNFGVLENHTWEEIGNFEPPILLIEVGNDLHTVNPQGGEPFENLWERAKKFRRFLFREYAGHSILVVSHGVFLQMFHGLLKGLSCIESLTYYPKNLELSIFSFDGKRLIDHKIKNLIKSSVSNF